MACNFQGQLGYQCPAHTVHLLPRTPLVDGSWFLGYDDDSVVSPWADFPVDGHIAETIIIEDTVPFLQAPPFYFPGHPTFSNHRRSPRGGVSLADLIESEEKRDLTVIWPFEVDATVVSVVDESNVVFDDDEKSKVGVSGSCPQWLDACDDDDVDEEDNSDVD